MELLGHAVIGTVGSIPITSEPAELKGGQRRWSGDASGVPRLYSSNLRVDFLSSMAYLCVFLNISTLKTSQRENEYEKDSWSSFYLLGMLSIRVFTHLAFGSKQIAFLFFSTAITSILLQ